jgi:hypothetical protein
LFAGNAIKTQGILSKKTTTRKIMKKIVAILLITGAFLFNACQKNLDAFVADPFVNKPDTNWYNNITSTMPVTALQNDLKIMPAIDSFEVSNSVVNVTISGMLLGFPANCCTNSGGQAVTGKINIETQLIKNKGDMVLMNKPTSSNGQLLVSGGEIFISLNQNGQQLQLAPNARVFIRYADAVAPDPKMKLFYGDETNPQQFNWVPSFDSIRAGNQFYEIVSTKLRWINCDYFYDTTGTVRSTVSAYLPFNYTNANTETFLVFKNIRSVLGMYGDVAEKRFISVKVPNNLAATIVAISKQGNDYFLGKEQITTGVNVTAGNQKVSLTPVKTSLADIKAFLATL